ncbi:hypothetical protein QQS21_007297 [Conoideocrella luteorostrata]|uniref:Fibronectin type-III domain-containing protein n=1 Tax=Conoideocrella luteorostrata TaxID=1105319 RepID=A0AAJ0FZK8_9HYPO|nr:hypothetical protein QQS21_007297 [Conoideocrella luteorostrata]
MSWDLLLLITLSVAFLSLWSLRRYLSASRKIVYVVVAAVLLHHFGRAVMHRIYFTAHEAVVRASPVTRFRIIMTVCAVIWLLHRSIQTLWKPVSELVSILGVDIPQAPEVCLAGIRSDAATLAWARPNSHRLAPKYLIQVNGVQVGEATGNEAGITITGLKPNHFYNIRVVAVGHNNFRSGSPVIRLRTFGKDGRPQLGNSRLPTNFVDPDQSQVEGNDDTDDADEPSSSLPTVEATPVLDSITSASREAVNVAPGQRRNTVNRRHSPSVASGDQTQSKSLPSIEPEMSLLELNNKFENIRKEIETTLQLLAKEQAEASQQEEELKKERDRKRQALKEKEEHTTQLKATIRSTGEQMRTADKERQKKEQLLKEKEAKKTKIRDSIVRVEKEVERMKKERKSFDTQKKELAEKRDKDVDELDASNAELQKKCAELEAELKEKGKQLQDLKATREELPGADDEQWKEEDSRMQREWDLARRDLHGQLVTETKRGVHLDQQRRSLSQQLTIMQQQADVSFYNQPLSTGLEYDPSTAPQNTKRLSYTGNGGVGLGGTPMSSPPPLAHVEPNFQDSTGFNPIGFVPGLFMDMPTNTDGTMHSEAEFKAAGGPLSPTAQTLLPSNIFDDIEDSEDMKATASSILPEPVSVDDEGPQSPVSPAPSYNAFSSPHGSNHNLPFSQYTDAGERKSLNMNSSPIAQPGTSHRFSNILSNLHLGGKASKASDDSGPLIGSLKSGQSQSFPRGIDEGETAESRWRFPWMNRSSTGQDGSVGSAFAFSARRVNSLRGPRVSAISDREHGHSRPSSITSIERPSTDGGSIWGAPGDAHGLMNRVWSPNDNNPWPSRNGSRRPSVHGSTTALTTTLASADDEILDDRDLRDPRTRARQVGVIGSRLPAPSTAEPGDSPKSMNPRLNPAARPFKLALFGMGDQDKDRDKTKGKGKGKEVLTPTIELPHSHDDSPSDSRVSRDTYSLHTGTSVSESHESLQLDLTQSNTPSDINSVSTSNMKEPEVGVVRKLFRKGSSSKFSLSTRLGMESGLFKKGPGSTANSDRNVSSEQRSSIGDADDLGEDGATFGRSYDSMTSSPALGPSKSKESREGRMSSWRFSMKKKSKDTGLKEKESPEMDRAPDEE